MLVLRMMGWVNTAMALINLFPSNSDLLQLYLIITSPICTSRTWTSIIDPIYLIREIIFPESRTYNKPNQEQSA